MFDFHVYLQIHVFSDTTMEAIVRGLLNCCVETIDLVRLFQEECTEWCYSEVLILHECTNVQRISFSWKNY